MSASVAACCASGSSPLTRGKRAGNRVGQLVPGLIPAHAGKTVRRRRTLRSRRAHPHSGRENTTKKRSAPIKTGLSPLAQGKLQVVPDVGVMVGLIPAHAGKTHRVEKMASPSGAHPRSRGENSKSSRILVEWSGSSPLTRGKQEGERDLLERVRLIPAHAGKTG